MGQYKVIVVLILLISVSLAIEILNVVTNTRTVYTPRVSATA